MTKDIKMKKREDLRRWRSSRRRISAMVCNEHHPMKDGVVKPRRVSLNKAVNILTAGAVNMLRNYSNNSCYWNTLAEPEVAEIHTWRYKKSTWKKIIVVHGCGDWNQTAFGEIIAVDKGNRLWWILDTDCLYHTRWRWPEDTYDVDAFMWTDGYHALETDRSQYLGSRWWTFGEDKVRPIIVRTRKNIREFFRVCMSVSENVG
jgi:hypothetical protein